MYVGRATDLRGGFDLGTAQDVIRALYKRLLLRAPDANGLAQWVAIYEKGSIDLDSMLSLFLQSEEFKANFPHFTRTYGPGDLGLTNDHSQGGEFFELLKLIVSRGAPGKILVDVGANGKERSNSYDLLRHFGWKGLLIEANPALREQILTDFSGLDFELVSVAISDEDGTGTLSLGINSDVSSLSERNTANWGPIFGSVPVAVRRLPPILEENGIPRDFDLLSLDIEGYDSRVLNDLIEHSHFRPTWVIIEGSHNFTVSDPRRIGVSELVCKEYEVSARTRANLILARG